MRFRRNLLSLFTFGLVPLPRREWNNTFFLSQLLSCDQDNGNLPICEWSEIWNLSLKGSAGGTGMLADAVSVEIPVVPYRLKCSGINSSQRQEGGWLMDGRQQTSSAFAAFK